MKVAVIGASGNLGVRLLDELTSRGHPVTAIVRNPARLNARENVVVRIADANDPDTLAPLLAGHDAIMTTLAFLGVHMEALLEAVRTSGVRRFIVAGHSGSLEVAPEVQLLDSGSISEFAKPEALDAREAFKALRKADDLDWSYASPGALMTPGRRTGHFRLGGDKLIRDRLGESRISMEDFAIVLADELERPQHIRQRFTAAY